MAEVEERTGEAFEAGEQLTVVGRKLQPNEMAPNFTLESFQDGAIHQVSLSDSAGTMRLLNVINSLDTPVCHVETHRWEDACANVPSLAVYTVSMDLPFAQARWQAAEGATHTMLSAHKDEGFGREYGVLLKEWRLLQRAVFVLDGEGKVLHAEYVPDQLAEPDYDAALRAAGVTPVKE